MTEKCKNDIFDTLSLIADSIWEIGNDPHDQLLRYITAGDVTYITRRNNARARIQTVDKKVSSSLSRD